MLEVVAVVVDTRAVLERAVDVDRQLLRASDGDDRLTVIERSGAARRRARHGRRDLARAEEHRDLNLDGGVWTDLEAHPVVAPALEDVAETLTSMLEVVAVVVDTCADVADDLSEADDLYSEYYGDDDDGSKPAAAKPTTPSGNSIALAREDTSAKALPSSPMSTEDIYEYYDDDDTPAPAAPAANPAARSKSPDYYDCYYDEYYDDDIPPLAGVAPATTHLTTMPEVVVDARAAKADVVKPTQVASVALVSSTKWSSSTIKRLAHHPQMDVLATTHPGLHKHLMDKYDAGHDGSFSTEEVGDMINDIMNLRSQLDWLAVQEQADAVAIAAEEPPSPLTVAMATIAAAIAANSDSDRGNGGEGGNGVEDYRETSAPCPWIMYRLPAAGLVLGLVVLVVCLSAAY